MMKWDVWTPRYETYGDEFDPPEMTCDCVEVDIPDDGPLWRQRHAAKWAAVPIMRRDFATGWVAYQSGDSHPLTGMMAMREDEMRAEEEAANLAEGQGDA